VKHVAAVAVLALALVPVAAGGRTAGTPGWAGCRAFTGHAPVLLHRPRSIMIACGDGNFWVGALHWKTWTAGGASATGTAHANDCDPYCAAGHFHIYPVAVTLTSAKTCGGRSEYTKLAWRFATTKPQGPRSGSTTFRCA
jgi:hypothetical protein